MRVDESIFNNSISNVYETSQQRESRQDEQKVHGKGDSASVPIEALENQKKALESRVMKTQESGCAVEGKTDELTQRQIDEIESQMAELKQSEGNDAGTDTGTNDSVSIFEEGLTLIKQMWMESSSESNKEEQVQEELSKILERHLEAGRLN